MGLMRSLYAGVSGLRNHQVMMDVLGNNISNVNTIGFKTGRVTFSEMFAQTLRGTTQPLSNLGGTNPIQVGLGMSLSTIDTLFSQGNIESTGQTTDLAIQGDGFFIISDGANRYYTRAGNFQFDGEGTMIMPGTGMRVQGFLANDDGVIEPGSLLSDIKLPFGKKIPAKATSRITLAGNLDASAQPKGNILSTEEMWAVEDGNTSVDGLLATGALNNKISGMIDGSTHIKVNYGGVEKTYQWVSTDPGTGNAAFHTFNDLIAEINADFGGAGLTVTMNSAGALEFSGSDVIDITSNNPLLETAFQSVSGDLTAGNLSSDQFSHVATASDLLVNLRDKNGQSLGLVAGDEIRINGQVGGNSITEYSFTVGATTTYNDYANYIETAFGLTNKDGVEIDATNGALKIHADGGTKYEISGLDIRADDTPGAGGTDRTIFNGIFDSTPGNYNEDQKAEDVQQSASITVYDTQGNSFDVTLIYTKDVAQPNRWTWKVKVPEPATVTGGGSGYVEFNGDGSLKSFKFDDNSSSIQLDPGTGSNNLVSISIDPGEIGGFDGVTQLAGPSTTALITSQDGYGTGSLANISIDEYGQISGTFSNGVVQLLGQLVLASFNNPGGLMRTEDNLFTLSGNSGDPIVSTPGAGISASIVSGALEQSNVDLAEEFTKMIVAQRGFQANARIITTADDLLAEVTNLKR
ncbi:MAG: hypothetical protein Kow0037_19890 [Calditrichia bacterium]